MAKAPALKDDPKTPAVISELDRLSEDYAGAGTSMAAEDSLIPLIRILQSNSPQVDKRGSSYVEGAEPGAIWLRSSTPPIASGEDGIIFQPVMFQPCWTEWEYPRVIGTPGFVTMYLTKEELPDDREEIPDPKDPKGRRKITIRKEAGTEIVEQRNEIGYVVREDGSAVPYVIPFTGSGHTVHRSWNTTIKNKPVLPSGRPKPRWRYLYRLTTHQRTNAKGTWFVFNIEDVKEIETVEEFRRGEALYKAFETGERTMAAPDHIDEDAGTDEV